MPKLGLKKGSNIYHLVETSVESLNLLVPFLLLFSFHAINLWKKSVIRPEEFLTPWTLLIVSLWCFQHAALPVYVLQTGKSRGLIRFRFDIMTWIIHSCRWCWIIPIASHLYAHRFLLSGWVCIWVYVCVPDTKIWRYWQPDLSIIKLLPAIHFWVWVLATIIFFFH